ncbi:MAG: sensor histidine kinase [Desulfobacteraceae bacterium]|nr:MAG: sensor histidine kinase [Desulfobacteraceae bacterium]
MKPARMESGLLTIFRLYLIAELIFILINLHVHSARGLLPGRTGLAVAFAVGSVAALMGYLSPSRLRDKLGRLYFPLAIVFAVLFSLAAQHLFLSVSVSEHAGGSAESAWQAFLFLFVPLVLVSWQYGFRSVAAYCLLTTLIDGAVLWWAGPDLFLLEQTQLRLLFIRFLSFFLVGYVISRIMRQLRRERHALQEANRKLERFMAALEELTVSRERNRLARELHDTLAHTLSGLAVQLEAIDTLWTGNSGQARRMLHQSLAATREGLTETRKAIQAIRATPLQDLGLVQAIRRLAGAKAEQSGLRLSLDLPPGIEGLPPEVEQCFYRIGQEAIENAARHAQASSLGVMLAGGAGQLQMVITDDGIGFDPAAVEPGRHFGLQGISERAGLIHAVLDVASAPGKGTRLSLAWRPAESAM